MRRCVAQRAHRALKELLGCVENLPERGGGPRLGSFAITLTGTRDNIPVFRETSPDNFNLSPIDQRIAIWDIGAFP
jgi:hypothetical protein